ncbi:MAG: ChaN family lipoprotein [Thiogranum sp.]|nr:ChaN family lipoprotein [Thiogranum sp.]
MTAPVFAVRIATLAALLALFWLSGCARASAPAGAPALSEVAATPALDLSALSTVQDIIPRLADTRVVMVGEQHTRYDHHLVQLDIIRGLHRQNPRLAIGLEMFQQPFQRHLDDYVAGDIDEQAMLRATEYYQRWGMDYSMYAPILRYAREHRLPLVALNVPVELTREVGRVGLDGLLAAQRAALPAEIQPADTAYQQRMREVFSHHPNDHDQDFQHFLDVQLVWDEGMAACAAEYLQSNPEQRMVILAGNSHLAYDSPIPGRLARRTAVTMRVILNSWSGPIEPGLADFLLFPEERQAPASGKIGAMLEPSDEGVIVASCLEDSPCARAGMRSGDRIASIDQTAIDSMADLRRAMWHRKPSEQIQVEVVRGRLLGGDKTFRHQLTLQ